MVSGSKGEVGSSKNNILGSLSSSTAIDTRFLWPPDKSQTLLFLIASVSRFRLASTVLILSLISRFVTSSEIRNLAA